MKSNSYKFFYSIIVAIILVLIYVSFFTNNSENYLFPQFIISGMLVLTLLLWFESDANKITQSTHLKALMPGLGICIVYVSSMNFIGFYLSSIVVFFVIVSIYQDRQKIDSWFVLLIKLGKSIVFILVLYVLFAKILHVRMPTGVFF